MEKIWDDFIKREEMECSPGVIDQDRVRALTLNTYLVHIREMVKDGENQLPFFVADHIESVMMDIFISQTYVLEGRRPDNEEINAYLNDPENVEARKHLVSLCINANPENWPEVERQLLEMIPDGSLEKINWNSVDRKENAKKWSRLFEENGGIIEL